MKYKVGEEVYVPEFKMYIKLVSIVEEGPMGTIWRTINRDGNEGCINQNMLHETAETMFKKIGYTKDEDEYNVDFFSKETAGRIIVIHKETGEWYGVNHSKSGGDCHIQFTVDEHLAIHQQLIELRKVMKK